MGPETEVLVRFDGVRLGYGRHTVLHELSFAVRKGEFLGVIGPNGAGKTTVLRAMLGLLPPRAGRIDRAAGLRYGYVRQRQFLDTLFPFSVEEVVRMGRYGRRPPFRRLGREDLDAVAGAMETAGISRLRARPYRELSGGQRQRALIARALAARPDVLILDEPTNDMDLAGEASIMDLVSGIRRDLGVTVILVSHLLHVVLDRAERILFLVEGKAREHDLAELLDGRLLAGIYGRPVEIGESRGRRYLVVG